MIILLHIYKYRMLLIYQNKRYQKPIKFLDRRIKNMISPFLRIKHFCEKAGIYKNFERYNFRDVEIRSASNYSG